MNSKIIYVNKITKKSFNKLQDFGYEVRFLDAQKKEPFIKYTYEKTVNPKNIKTVKVVKCAVCTTQHIK